MKLILLSIIFFVIAACVMIHQYLFYDVWFEWSDLHHETFIFAFIFIGIILLIFGRGK